MSQYLLIAIASIITLGIAAEWIAWRIGLPSILVLLLFGMVVGPFTGLLDPDLLFGDLLFPVVSVSVAIILFEGGTSLRLQELRQVGRVVTSLVTVGAIVTWALATCSAHYILGMDLEPALLLGAILVVTGPTVIVPLLRQMRPQAQVGNTLKWEGILIDPVGAVLAVLVFEVLLAGGLEVAWTVGTAGLLTTIVIGAVLAAAGAGLMIWLLARRWVPEFLQSPLSLTLVVAAFAGSNALQPESGLLTVTLMGMVMANQRSVNVRHIVEFKENLRVLLISSLFIVLAARLDLADLRAVGIPEVAFVATLILVVRPLAVAIATVGSDFGWRERVVLGWVAPRGIVAAAVSSLFALELTQHGYGNAGQLASVTFLVIIATVLVYGFTSAPLARALGIAEPDPQGVLFVGAHPWAREIARELHELGFPVRLADTNRHNIAQARLAGLPGYYGSTLTEGALDQIDLAGIGYLLAVTSNDEVNSLTGLNFSEVLGTDAVYQLPPEGYATATDDTLLGRHLRGRFLFRPEADYWQLTARFDAGAGVKATKLSEAFGYRDFLEQHPDAIPLFVAEDGELTVVTLDRPPAPQSGQTIVAVVGV
ncbi:MAG: cation:proton antiporter [Candidatus Palauibacterales bacterium]|nr:cation:proton antiporter [Candidatus Palauibacterales bacterium]